MIDGEHVVRQKGLQALQRHDMGLLLGNLAIVEAHRAFSSQCIRAMRLFK
jgi:hypothetical protein